jgi:hypothetical protein
LFYLIPSPYRTYNDTTVPILTTVGPILSLHNTPTRLFLIVGSRSGDKHLVLSSVVSSLCCVTYPWNNGPRRRNHRIRRIASSVEQDCYCEDDGCGERHQKIARFKSASHWKEQPRISSSVTSAFFIKRSLQKANIASLTCEIVAGAVNLCLIDWASKSRDNFETMHSIARFYWT